MTPNLSPGPPVLYDDPDSHRAGDAPAVVLTHSGPLASVIRVEQSPAWRPGCVVPGVWADTFGG